MARKSMCIRIMTISFLVCTGKNIWRKYAPSGGGFVTDDAKILTELLMPFA